MSGNLIIVLAATLFGTEIELTPEHTIRTPALRMGEFIHAEFSPDGKMLAISVAAARRRRGGLAASTVDSVRDNFIDGSEPSIVSDYPASGVVLWDLKAGEEVGFLSSGSRVGNVSHLHFVDAGRRLLALVSDENGIYCWDVQSKGLVFKRHDRGLHVQGLAVSDDQKTIAAIKSGAQGGVYLHDAESGKQLRYVGKMGSKRAVVFRPPLAQQLSTDINLWTLGEDPATIERPRRYAQADVIEYRPNGDTLYGLRRRSTTLHAWKLTTKELTLPFLDAFSAECPAGINHFAVDPRGQMMATANVGDGRAVCLWDLNTGDLIAKGNAHGSEPRYVGFSPTGERLVSTDWDGNVIVWRLEQKTRGDREQ